MSMCITFLCDVSVKSGMDIYDKDMTFANFKCRQEARKPFKLYDMLTQN